MAKKKEFKPIFENLEPESTDAHPQVPEPVKDEAAQDVSVPTGDQDEEAQLRAEMMAAEGEGLSGQAEAAQVEDQAEGEEKTVVGEIPPTGSAAQEPEEENPDELLEDVRKSLLEEDAREHEQQPKWWRRFGRSSQKKKEEEPAKAPEEMNLPELAVIQTADVEAAPGEETKPDDYEEELDELIDMLAAEEETVDDDLALVTAETAVMPKPEPEPEPEPEKPVDLEELKKQAFQSRPKEGEDESFTEVRAVALEGDEEVFVEVESRKPDVMEERLSAVENALKPYQRYINFTLAFLGLIMALTAGFLIYNAYQRSVIQSTPTQVSDLPYPTSVGLPGGWNFTLGKGSLTANGSWNPTGAEWLQGTEVCRWVALPWSRQLEAVLRTLDSGDPIALGMSNNDKLTYNVYSIKQMSPEEMKQLDSNSPCLLIVLPEKGAEKRWVLTALP